MTAAASERSGTRQPGANWPASAEAASAPIMIPTSMIDVTSYESGAASALACCCQYGQLATSMPSAVAPFAPQSANADVMPHGRPASAKVAKLRTASAMAPTNIGHGPTSHAGPLARAEAV